MEYMVSSSIQPIDKALIRCYHSRPEWTWEQWQWRGTPHSPKPQHYWNLTIRLFSVISRTRVGEILPRCREVVSVFYSPSQLGNQRKDHIDPTGPMQRNRPKQLQTHNLPTDDVKNINSTNKGRDLLLTNKLQIVPWEKERMPQRIQSYFT